MCGGVGGRRKTSPASRVYEISSQNVYSAYDSEGPAFCCASLVEALMLTFNPKKILDVLLRIEIRADVNADGAKPRAAELVIQHVHGRGF